MALGLALKISPNLYNLQIEQLAVQLNRLNDIKAQYQQLIDRLGQEVFNADDNSSDVANLNNLIDSAKIQIKALDSNIDTAQATQSMIRSVVQKMEENNTNIANIIGNSVEIAGSSINTVVNVAKAAKAAAEVAAIM